MRERNCCRSRQKIPPSAVSKAASAPPMAVIAASSISSLSRVHGPEANWTLDSAAQHAAVMFSWVRNLLAIPLLGGPVPLCTRSWMWPALRDAWLTTHPTCAACGSRSDLTAHHLTPVHVDSSLELTPINLLTLCPRCHLFVGHLCQWSSWNWDARFDADSWLNKIKERPHDARG